MGVMKQRTPIVTLILSLLLAPVFATQGQEEDFNAEDAKTPKSLLELLPDDDKDWPKPFSFVFEIEDWPGAMYMSWRIDREDKDIVIAMTSGESDRVTRTRVIYSEKDAFKGFTSREFIRDAYEETKTGKVVGDKDEVTLVRDPLSSDRPSSEVKSSIPIEKFQNAYLLEWVPLIVAYHARQGNVGYRVKIKILEELDSVVVFNAEVVGTEQAEVDGSKQPAHLILVEAYPLNDEDANEAEPELKLSMRFLDDGGFLDASLTTERMKGEAKRVTEQEIKTRFGDPEAAE